MGTILCGHNPVWHNPVWVQSCVGTIPFGHNPLWVQSSDSLSTSSMPSLWPYCALKNDFEPFLNKIIGLSAGTDNPLAVSCAIFSICSPLSLRGKISGRGIVPMQDCTQQDSIPYSRQFLMPCNSSWAQSRTGTVSSGHNTN